MGLVSCNESFHITNDSIIKNTFVTIDLPSSILTIQDYTPS